MHCTPIIEAYETAGSNVVTDAYSLKVDLNEMKTCLAVGYPFVFGLHLLESFNNARPQGIVPMPNPKESARETHGRFDLILILY